MFCSDSLADLYLRHIGELRAFLVRRLACRETAHELAHETFVRVMAAPGGAAIENPRALLYRVAGNLAVDHYRANPVRPECFVDFADCVEMASPAPGPEQIASARQSLERLRRAIEELPPQCRRIFALHKFDGRCHADIATEYGITRNAVEKHLVRALVHLRLRMA